MAGMNTRGTKAWAGQVLLGLTLSVVSTGCKKAEPQGALYCDRTGYVQASRDFTATDGKAALDLPTNARTTTGYFGKTYNPDWLAGVAHASIRETIAYIRKTGARLYRAPGISSASARPMQNLSQMPADIASMWFRADQSAGFLSDEPCAFLAGLYLGKGTHALASAADQAVIVVREDASRWTLVHEFMHHNFKTQSAATGYDDDFVQARAQALTEKIEKLKRDHSMTNSQYAQRMADLFQELIPIADRLILEYQFEEVAIEAMLQDRYERANLGFVPWGSYANASWYIEHSRKGIEKLYQGMDATHDEIYRLAATNALFTNMNQLSRYTALRDRRLADLEKVLERNKNRMAGPRFAATADFTPARGAVPCAHAQMIEDTLAALTNAIRAPRATE